MLPSTIEEAAVLFAANYPAPEFQAWLAMDEDEAIGSKQHFGACLWVRNNWIYGEPSPLAEELDCFADGPDGLLRIILQSIWRWLHGKEPLEYPVYFTKQLAQKLIWD